MTTKQRATIMLEHFTERGTFSALPAERLFMGYTFEQRMVYRRADGSFYVRTGLCRRRREARPVGRHPKGVFPTKFKVTGPVQYLNPR